MSYIKARVIIIIISIMLLQAGCGSYNLKDGKEASSKQGDSGVMRDITCFIDGKPDVINPLKEDFADSFVVYSNVFESLLSFKEDTFELQPGLAERWVKLKEEEEESSLNESYIFYLKKNVTFHDGTPFNTDAVLQNINIIMNEKWETNEKRSWIKSVKRLDDYSVSITFIKSKKVGDVLRKCASPRSLPIISPKSLNSVPPSEIPLAGTGPFRFSTLEKGKSVIIEKYSNYWGKKSMVEKVIFKSKDSYSIDISGSYNLNIPNAKGTQLVVIPLNKKNDNTDLKFIELAGNSTIYFEEFGPYLTNLDVDNNSGLLSKNISLNLSGVYFENRDNKDEPFAYTADYIESAEIGKLYDSINKEFPQRFPKKLYQSATFNSGFLTMALPYIKTKDNNYDYLKNRILKMADNYKRAINDTEKAQERGRKLDKNTPIIIIDAYNRNRQSVEKVAQAIKLKISDNVTINNSIRYEEFEKMDNPNAFYILIKDKETFSEIKGALGSEKIGVETMVMHPKKVWGYSKNIMNFRVHPLGNILFYDLDISPS